MKRKYNFPAEDFFEQIEKLTLPDLERLLEELCQNKEDNREKICRCLDRRKSLLHGIFECTPDNMARLHTMANLIKNRVTMLRDKGDQLYKQMYVLWQEGKNERFTDFYVEISLQVSFNDENSILHLADDHSGSDYLKIAEILDDFNDSTFENLISGRNCLDYSEDDCRPTFKPDMDIDADCGEPWFFDKFSMLRDLSIGWEFHNLLFHSNYALQDIIRINDMWAEAKIVWQHITPVKENDVTGIPSDFTGLDRITGGWQPGDLVIVGACASMGKTAFMLSMAHNMAINHECNVALFSLEMSAKYMVKRMNKMGIEQKKKRNKQPDNDKWHQLVQLNNSTIFIDDTPALSVSEFYDKCTRLMLQHNVRIVFIDYLQLMTLKKELNRKEEVSNILRMLKDIAKELDITIIVLTQLNRSVNTQYVRFLLHPKLTDLRDCELESIEENVDIVVLIHRHEYYGHSEDENGNSLEGVAEIIIAKNRTGKLGKVRLTFDKTLCSFTNTEKHDE